VIALSLDFGNQDEFGEAEAPHCVSAYRGCLPGPIKQKRD